jgi:uncharacterized protein (TIGR03437 family)
VRSNAIGVNRAQAAPGIFTSDSSGSGAAAVINQDGTKNTPSNAAARGSVITFFATGEGLTNPPGTAGAIAPSGTTPRPVAPVSVRIGGIDATIQFAGTPANAIQGLIQVNAVVPEGVATGDAVPVILTVGNFSSPGNVHLAIR